MVPAAAGSVTSQLQCGSGLVGGPLAGHSTTMAPSLAALLSLCLLLSSARAANNDAQAVKFLASPSTVNLNQMVSNPKVDGESNQTDDAVCDSSCFTSLHALPASRQCCTHTLASCQNAALQRTHLLPWLLLRPAGTVRRLYLQHLISTTPKNRLRALLLPLATPDVRKRVQIDINYLLDHPDEIVPYFTSRDADEVLILLGSMLNSEGAQVDMRRITPAQQKQLQSAVNSGELSKWVANKYRNGRVDPDTVSVYAHGIGRCSSWSASGCC